MVYISRICTLLAHQPHRLCSSLAEPRNTHQPAVLGVYHDTTAHHLLSRQILASTYTLRRAEGHGRGPFPATMTGLSLVVCSTVLLALLQRTSGLVHDPIGFQEGARRVIDCPSGYFTGVDIYYTDSGSPFGRAMKGVRFYCSSGDIMVQYEGKKPADTVFGNTGAHPVTGKCPGSKHIVGFKWRESDERGEGGLRHFANEVNMYCGTEDSDPVSVTWAKETPKDHPNPVKSHMCSDSAADKGGAASSMVVWYTRDYVTGWQINKCKSGRF